MTARLYLPGVIPGAYTLQFERQGFATTQLRGIMLSVGDTRTLLVRMKVGPVAESVTVDASGLTLNRTDGTVSTVVDRKLAEAVPLNGRSFQDLISMTPGIVTQSPQAAGQHSETQGDFSVNGQRPESNSFFVDGIAADSNGGVTSGHSRTVSTGSAAGATALGTTQSLVSVEALQEFRVLTSSYSAEYGRTPGGQFTFLTRSGTNDRHGSVFYNFRNNVFDAIDWFAGQQAPAPSRPAHHTAKTILAVPSAHRSSCLAATTAGTRHFSSHRMRDFTCLSLLHKPILIGQSCDVSICLPLAVQSGLDLFSRGQRPRSRYPGPSTDWDTFCLPFLPTSIPPVSAWIIPSLRNSPCSFALEMHPATARPNNFFPQYHNQLGSRTYSFGANSQLTANINNELRLGFVDNRSNVRSINGDGYSCPMI